MALKKLEPVTTGNDGHRLLDLEWAEPRCDDRCVSADSCGVVQETLISFINESFSGGAGLRRLIFAPRSLVTCQTAAAVCLPLARPFFLRMNCHFPSAEHQSTPCNLAPPAVRRAASAPASLNPHFPAAGI